MDLFRMPMSSRYALLREGPPLFHLPDFCPPSACKRVGSGVCRTAYACGLSFRHPAPLPLVAGPHPKAGGTLRLPPSKQTAPGGLRPNQTTP